MDGSGQIAPKPVDLTWYRWAERSLVWMPERGMGYFPVCAQPYDQAYFDKYAGYADTPIGRGLTQARIDLVARHHRGPILDVGVGCGQFVETRPETFGYDVNPAGVRWLRERAKFVDLYIAPEVGWRAATFWDSLEHIPDPALAVRCIAGWVFVSLPIFTDVEHVLRSKHYRKDEHCWYWTRVGFEAWMAEQGFEMVEANWMESDLGREDIMTFAFRRVR